MNQGTVLAQLRDEKARVTKALEFWNNQPPIELPKLQGALRPDFTSQYIRLLSFQLAQIEDALAALEAGGAAMSPAD